MTNETTDNGRKPEVGRQGTEELMLMLVIDSEVCHFSGSEDERGDAEVEGESDQVSYGKCHRSSGDLRVEFQ
jgi:hypothetical protein